MALNLLDEFAFDIRAGQLVGDINEARHGVPGIPLRFPAHVDGHCVKQVLKAEEASNALVERLLVHRAGAGLRKQLLLGARTHGLHGGWC